MLKIFLTISAVFSTGIAFADCEKSILTSDGSKRVVNYYEAGNGGPGDKRVGIREVLRDGEPVGKLHWVVEVLDAGENPRSLLTRIWTLDDGDLHTRQINYQSRPAHDTSLPSVPSGPVVVVGGTGEYAHATGTVLITYDGKVSTYEFDIRCN
ncbi:MAG: hypothetical protein AAGF27_10330 [Pseudomonadota bacterium]